MTRGMAVAAALALGLSACAGEPRQTRSGGAPDPCSASDLEGAFEFEGAAGSVQGQVTFTNSGPVCTLEGRPALTVGGDGAPTANVSPTGPWWKVDRDPQPAGWPVVTLDRGGEARVRARWSNWCSDVVPPWRFRLPGGEVTVTGQLPPPCNGPGQASTVEAGPYEPA